MMDESDSYRNFVLQQSLPAAACAECRLMTSALLFQPRVIALWVVIGALLRSSYVFLALGMVLWWGVLVPRWNLFEVTYNRFFARGAARVRLERAAAPRRFAQGMAGTFALAIGTCLLLGARTAAAVLWIFLAVAVAALLFGRFCLGSFIYHLLRGRAAFAVRTLPWGRGV